jgi:mRNA interferase RelE/StbE
LAFSVEFNKDAAKYLKLLDAPTKERFRELLSELIADPFNPAYSKQLVSRTERSARVGDFRMLFEVDVKADKIFVVRVAPRGQVYR